MSTRIYEFRQIGARETARSLLELAAANVQLAKSETAAARATSGSRGGQYDAHVKARAAALKEQAQAEKRAQRAAEQAAKASARASIRAETDKTRAAEREAKKREQIANREANALARSHERQLRQHRREQERAARAMRPRTSLTSLVGDRMKGIAGNFVMGLGLAGGVAGAAAFVGSNLVDYSQQAYRQRALNEQRAKALAISGGDRTASAALLADADKTARAVRGTRAEDVLAGQQKFVAMTGRLDLARTMGGTMATAARATGATEEDIASTMATFQQKFGIDSEAGMQQALAMMRVAGQSGAFEIGDAARYYTEMGAAGTRFGLDKGAQGVGQLNALAQLAMRSTKSGAEASTGVSAMLRQLTAKSEEIKTLNKGKEVVFADKGKTQTNDVVDVLVGTLKATKGNRAQLQSIFGDEGMKGASEAIRIFTEAGKALGENATEAQKLAAGEKAVRAAFQDLSGSAGQWSSVLADAAVMTDSASSKWQTAFESMVSEAGSKLTPMLNQLAEHFDVLLSPLTSFAEVVGEAGSALASMIEFMKRNGLIEDRAPSESKAELDSRRNQVANRLRDLNRPDSQLTTAEKSEKKRLQQEKADLDIVAARGERESLNPKNKPGDKEWSEMTGREKAAKVAKDYLTGGVIGATIDNVPSLNRATAGDRDTLKNTGLGLLTGGASTVLQSFMGAGEYAKESNAKDQAARNFESSATKMDAAAQKFVAAAEKLAASGGARPPTSLPGT